MSEDKSAFPPPMQRLRPIGLKAFVRADRRLDAVRNARDLATLQKRLRKVRDRLMGPLPDPAAIVAFTPGRTFFYLDLEVQQVTLHAAEGYDITGWSLRRQDLTQRLPGLAIAAGHAEAGSLHPRYVMLAAYAARCGYHVFSFDPPGQGGRREAISEQDHPVYWSPCNQHQRIGVATTAAGVNLTHFFMSDCVTAVSFLAQSKGVDPARIGFAGQSGGGYQTYLAMAADPRIKVAVPCQATYVKRGLLHSLGALDMEQWYIGAWSEGFDSHEMAALFAPRPLRICSEYGDGAQLSVYNKIKPIYERLGRADDINLASASVDHAMDRPCRELLLQWLLRYLPPIQPIAVEPELPGFEKFHDRLTRCMAGTNARGHGIIALCQRRIAKKPRTPVAVRNAIAANPFLKSAGAARASQEPPLPFTVLRGNAARGTVLVVDSQGGHSSWAKRQAEIARTMARRVILLDVFNTGSVRSLMQPPKGAFISKYWQLYGPPNQHATHALLAGTCSISLAVQDMREALRAAKAGKDDPIRLVGRGWSGIACALLSVMDRRVDGCCLTGVPESLASLAGASESFVDYNYIVPGLALKTDLAEVFRQTPSVRYAVVAPLRLKAPRAAYGDAGEYPNLRLFAADTRNSATAAVRFVCGSSD